MRICAQQPVEQQMADVQADKDATVAAVFLDGRVVQVHKPDGPVEQRAELHGDGVCFIPVARRQRIVVERDAVDYRDEQQRPVRAAFSLSHVPAVVDWEEDMRRFAKVWKSIAEGPRIGGLQEHKGHARAKEDYIRLFVFR